MAKVFSYSASIAQVIALATFFLLSFAPLVEMEMGLLKKEKLSGVQRKITRPKVSSQAIKDGSYQQSFEKWFSKNVGFRGPAIRTENQLNYSLFGDIYSKGDTNIVLGNDNFLFEQSYIHNFNRNYPIGQTQLAKVIDKLVSLQTSLQEKLGVAFTLVITPSKPEIYPEKVPANLIHPDREKRISDYEIFKSLATQSGLNLVDGVEITKKLKEETGYLVFAPGGVHWGYWTACKVGNKVIDSLRHQLEKNVQRLNCGPHEFRDRPYHTDGDLLNMTNLWDKSEWKAAVPYPNLKETFYDPESYHPTVLMVGDSFAWNPLHFFDKDAIFRKRKFLYYYSTEYNFWTSGSVETPKRRKNKKNYKGKVKLDWNKTFSDREAVVIFANQSVLHSAGLGFVDDALSWLSGIESKGK